MFFYEGQRCPVCGKFFSENDDIVACPQCGAPHHRDCWKQEGHCHFADAHGTDHQWAKTEPEPSVKEQTATRRCNNCGKDNPEFAEFCSRCGRELQGEDPFCNGTANNTGNRPPVGQYTPPPYSNYSPFGSGMPTPDPYGGVSRSESIDGISIDELAEVIGNNSAYYLPRFLEMNRRHTAVSWNWMGFLLPYNWLLFRKNYLWGLLTFLFSTALEIVTSIATGGLETTSTATIYSSLQQLLKSNSGELLLTVILLSGLLNVMLRILVGLFGNRLYMQGVLKKAKKWQATPSLRYNRNTFTAGGTSFAIAVIPDLVVLIIEYIVAIAAIL